MAITLDRFSGPSAARVPASRGHRTWAAEKELTSGAARITGLHVRPRDPRFKAIPELAAIAPLPASRVNFNGATINFFKDADSCSEHVANQMMLEFKKGGLGVMASDSTHGDEYMPNGNTIKREGKIYTMANNLFTVADTRKAILEGSLRLVNMDELDRRAILDPLKPIIPFNTNLIKTMPDIVRALEAEQRMHFIQPGKVKEFYDFVNKPYKFSDHKGPRFMFAGFGTDDAHIAYINKDKKTGKFPAKTHTVHMEETEKLRRNCASAVSIGMDMVKASEIIYITGKGAHKAKIVAEFFKDAERDDPQTAVGYVLKHYPQKVVINLDKEASEVLLKENRFFRTCVGNNLN